MERLEELAVPTLRRRAKLSRISSLTTSGRAEGISDLSDAASFANRLLDSEPAEFFAKRRGKAVGKDLMKFLRDAPQRPPHEGDELR
jgi:hypothetical protein